MNACPSTLPLTPPGGEAQTVSATPTQVLAHAANVVATPSRQLGPLSAFYCGKHVTYAAGGDLGNVSNWAPESLDRGHSYSVRGQMRLQKTQIYCFLDRFVAVGRSARAFPHFWVISGHRKTVWDPFRSP